MYFLKHKNEAFSKFKEWKIMVEIKGVINLKNLGLIMAWNFAVKNLMNSVLKMEYLGIEHVMKPLSKMDLLRG